ncbi:MAG: peptidoglycan-associated lipoprotein Pal [Oceanicaulis sp.]|uniref:peptidoglycan-associated lipoprotein Pal n=1 Tax=Glycocaulis sp. TaxID=1969725 RepID=UPI0025BFDC2F|nr:peptidoglycan-associated lipoprotein Pal [Glycocaulis sp.]MCC5982040.1 peptidoglycan-associated lipoprotein Pal [Oceanicaulis sp.]MCH8520438.1 peptidoglycan-associated lipoprotein Pal [Glycocaulis sp.]
MKLAPFAAVAAFSLLVTACASRPDTTEVVEGPGPVTRDTSTTPAGPVPGSIEDFQLNAGDRVFYGFDRFDLDSAARETLRRQAAWLASHPNARILIAGNTDERGTREYNLALGARRANSARDFLVSQGVDPSRISTVSYGKERPSCTQSTESCWAQNRNAITVITSGAVS